MHPILFELGKFKIYSYGVMVAAGFLVAVYLASREARHIGIARDKIFDVGLYALILGIAGARILHVFLEFEYYMSRPLEIFVINRGGLSIQGGLITGVLGGWFYIRRNKMPLWKTADIMAPHVALGQAIGRMGCFLNGCCYGMPTNSFLGIALPGRLLRLHPTQIYSSLFLFAAFFALKGIYRKKKFDGEVFFFYLIIFSIGRFFIDFIRGDLNPIFLNLKVSQFISIAIFAVSLIFMRFLKKSKDGIT